MSTTLQALLSPERLAEVDHWVAKFPAEHQQSATLQGLRIIQDQLGWISKEAMIALAEYLAIEPMAVFEVASFYSMYHLTPAGKHTIGLCKSISCTLNGSNNLRLHLEEKLQTKFGETTSDGKITLKHVECLGACVNAPVCNVGREYHEHLTPEKLDALVERLRQE
jgi:NADH-quinone oxidoreductase subunit E